MNLDQNGKISDNNLDPIPREEFTGFVERIDKSTLKPLNDPKCEHEWIDDDDEIGDMQAQRCIKCPLGRWTSKTTNSHQD